jgi:hypothetical protein
MKVETQAVNCHLPALVTSGLETQSLRDALVVDLCEILDANTNFQILWLCFMLSTS